MTAIRKPGAQPIPSRFDGIGPHTPRGAPNPDRPTPPTPAAPCGPTQRCSPPRPPAAHAGPHAAMPARGTPCAPSPQRACHCFSASQILTATWQPAPGLRDVPTQPPGCHTARTPAGHRHPDDHMHLLDQRHRHAARHPAPPRAPGGPMMPQGRGPDFCALRPVASLDASPARPENSARRRGPRPVAHACLSGPAAGQANLRSFVR